MSLKIVVLAKQVPDTRNVGKDAMKADGTNHQPCGTPRHLQPRRPQRLGAGPAVERDASGLHGDHADHGTGTRRRNHS